MKAKEIAFLLAFTESLKKRLEGFSKSNTTFVLKQYFVLINVQF